MSIEIFNLGLPCINASRICCHNSIFVQTYICYDKRVVSLAKKSNVFFLNASITKAKNEIKIKPGFFQRPLQALGQSKPNYRKAGLVGRKIK